MCGCGILKGFQGHVIGHSLLPRGVSRPGIHQAPGSKIPRNADIRSSILSGLEGLRLYTY